MNSFAGNHILTAVMAFVGLSGGAVIAALSYAASLAA